jgi:hypothetical protein
MKSLSIILLLLISSMSFGQTVANADAKLLDAAIEQYLKEMKSKFSIAPAEFIIESENKAAYDKVKKKSGSTSIVVKTKKELQSYSVHKPGKDIGFFSIDVEKSGEKYVVDIMDDGIKCTMKDGVASYSYDSFGAGRACELTFSSTYSFEDIDCLLLSADPEN